MRPYLLSSEPLDEAAIAAALPAKRSGALVTFVGRVRDQAGGRAVVKLEYDAYPEMAERVFAQIAQEAKAQFDVEEIIIHHRSGSLAVGDISVVVVVSAPHRGAAFDACRYVIDNLKHRAPIWKKEYGPGGATWVDDRP